MARPKARSIYQERISRNNGTIESRNYQSYSNQQSHMVVKRKLGKKKQFLLNQNSMSLHHSKEQIKVRSEQ